MTSQNHLTALPASSTDALLADLLRVHGPALMTYVVRLTAGDRAWAEDVLQETFVKAWRHSDRLTAERGSVRGWLSRVAHNLVMDGYRSARARPVEVGIEGAPSVPVDDATEQVLLQVVLRRAMDDLPSEHREALVEVYLRDRTATEAAVVLGVPVGTVKSRVFYAVRRLRATVDRDALAA